MEDDKLKQLFSNYSPDMAPSDQFMTRLQNNMRAVEIVKKHQEMLKRRNILAVAVAAASGFAVGVILTLLFPMLIDMMPSFNFTISHLHVDSQSIDYTIIAWIITGGLSLLTALSTYEMSLSGFRIKS